MSDTNCVRVSVSVEIDGVPIEVEAQTPQEFYSSSYGSSSPAVSAHSLLERATEEVLRLIDRLEAGRDLRNSESTYVDPPTT